MKDDVKAETKALEYCIAALKQVQKAKDPRERLAAVKLEVEFTERIEKLKESDRSPELELRSAEMEPVHAGGVR